LKKKVFSFVVLTLSIFGDEYDFDMDMIEQEPYEYSGYLRVEDKAQRLRNSSEDTKNYLHLEGLFDFSYCYESLKFKTSLMAMHDYIKDKVSDSSYQTNELYIESKLSNNHILLVGKESLLWGKGYFFNPVAFFDRVKDPSQPTQTREGFVIAKYSYNKSFSSELKNLSFDFIYLPSSDSVNRDYYEEVTNSEDANNIAMKLYLLLYDTDIDFIYNYSDVANEKIGIDFSKNIQTNFEIHGEYAKVFDSYYSYLLGLRYLTKTDLTIISEYIYLSDDFPSPFIAKDYLITLITQKEPFEWLYSSVYYKNMINLQDNSQQNKFGITYSFKNSMNIDISYNLNSGDNLSEFGKRPIKDFLWGRLTWSY